jgi:hypothetical protein
MALSAIENRYLSALTEQEFPTFTPEQSAMAAPEGVDGMQLAAGPSATMSDAGGGMGEIKATPRNPVMGGVADFVRGVRDLANQYEIKDFVPLLGGMGVGDLLIGKSPEELEEWAYGNAPMRIPEMTNVPMVKTGRKEQLADTVFLGADAADASQVASTVSVEQKLSMRDGGSMLTVPACARRDWAAQRANCSGGYQLRGWSGSSAIGHSSGPKHAAGSTGKSQSSQTSRWQTWACWLENERARTEGCLSASESSKHNILRIPKLRASWSPQKTTARER